MVDLLDIGIPWVDSPFLESVLSRSSLDETTCALIRTFARDGYLVFDPKIADLDAVASATIAACSRHQGYAQRLQDAWREIPQVRALACAPVVMALLDTLYRRRPLPMQTLNFGRGTEQRAHSDDFHFSCHPKGFMCGVWIALEDIDDDNGPLEVYPGSHRLPYLDLSHLGLAGSRQRDFELYARYEDMIQTVIAAAGLQREVLTVRKGQAVVWAANLLHGGTPIRDPARTRHSQVTHYYFEGGLYYQPQTSDPLIGRITHLDKPDVRTGERLPQRYAGRPFRPTGLLRRILRRLRR